MLTIIFGAGASYDSSPDYKPEDLADSRLPLAKELFSTRFAHIAQKYPIAMSLITRLRRASNIEHELESISADNGSNIPEQLLKIRRYIKDVIETAQIDWEKETYRNTVYYEFLDILQKWQEKIKVPINLVTFNYDTLLDTAFSTHLKVDLSDLDLYVNNNASCNLFKPHGSINWIHLAQLPIYTPGLSNIDYYAKQLTWSPHFYLASDSVISYKGYYKFPAIAVPTETKTMFEFPNNHKEKMQEAISKTTCLLSIGWKAEEKHFLDLWGSSEDQKLLHRIEVVNGNPSNTDKIIRSIKINGNIYSPNITSFSEGFSNYVPHRFTSFLTSLSSTL